MPNLMHFRRLLKKLIRANCNKLLCWFDLLDSCAGSDATLRAAREMNRNSYGFEFSTLIPRKPPQASSRTHTHRGISLTCSSHGSHPSLSLPHSRSVTRSIRNVPAGQIRNSPMMLSLSGSVFPSPITLMYFP